ncbi:MAG: hypothetical protein ABIJ45_14715, partial [Candidatus Zixiibacteriota bacterium]
MRKVCFILILFLLSVSGINLYAQGGVSSAAAIFLRLPIGARAAALGESYVAIADDATATHWNPAGLGQYPMSPKWFDIDIPNDLRPLKDMAVFQGEGTGEDFEHFDIWALTSKGLMRYRNYKWTDFDIITTRADQTVESVIRSYAGILGITGEEDLPNLIAGVAQKNNSHPQSDIDSLKSKIVSALPEDYSNMHDLDSAFINLNEAFNKCLIDWEAVGYAKELTQKALRDSMISETEADRIIFVLVKAKQNYLGRSLTIPYDVIFKGNLTSIGASEQYLWVSSDSGLYRFNGHSWQQFGTTDGLPSLAINNIKVYDDLVFLFTDSGLATYKGGTFTDYGPEQGLPRKNIKSATIVNDDIMWAVVENDLYKFDGTKWKNYFDNNGDSLLDAASAYESMKIYGNHREKDQFFKKFKELNTAEDKVSKIENSSSMSVDRINQIVDSLGVVSAVDIMDSVAASNQMADSLALANPIKTLKSVKLPITAGFQYEVLDINADEFGNLWVGTEFGLLRLNGYKWKRYGYREYKVGPGVEGNEATIKIDSAGIEIDTSGKTSMTTRGFETVYDIALKRVKGDSTRAERLAQQIRATNNLDSDTISYGEKIYLYANPSGAAIHHILIDGTNMYFAT